MTSFPQAEVCDGGRVYCDRSRAYLSVTEVEFNQGLLLQRDCSSLAEAVYQCLNWRVVLEFYGCEDYVH